MAEINEHSLRQLYEILGHEGGWSQLHCQAVNESQWGPRLAQFVARHGRQPTSEEFNKLKVLNRRLVHGTEEIIAWAKENNGKGNCFIGRAPRNKDGSVRDTRCLTLDIDPIKPKDEAATDEQFQEASAAGLQLAQHFNYGSIASSGNGVLLLFPLSEAVTSDEAERMGKQMEAEARELLKEHKVNVDSTFDAARLCKLVGTLSTKGNPSFHRQTWFLNTTDTSFRGYDEFIQRFEKDSRVLSTTPSFRPPVVEKGELDRSKADISLANRLKLQGFTAEDTYRALVAYATRPGREDDYKRIIEKLYYNKGNIQDIVNGPATISLWTPITGMEDYTTRERYTKPELPTGFHSLDSATHGLIRGHIFTVGARTNVGKTTFAITIAQSLCRAGRRVLFMSTENQYHEVWDRYIAAATGIPAFKLQHGIMSVEDQELYRTFVGEFQKHSFSVYDGSRPNIGIVKQAVEQANPDVLIFDYFQHVEGRETRELEEFVMQMKELAKEKQIAVLMCAQLHDGMVNLKTNRLYPPTLGSIKNCKALNDESRVVLLLDWARDEARGDGAVVVKGILAKNKGVRTDVLLKLDRSIPRFENGE